MTYPYQQPPPGYGPSPYGYAYDGPPGRVRPTGTSILLMVVTFGIYSYVYNYQVHDEMKRHSGRGIGGGIALLLTFLAGIAMPFLTPHEVGNLYERKGQRPPVRALTGLWLLVPALAGYVLFFAGFVLLLATASADPRPDHGSDPSTLAVVVLLLMLLLVLGGSVAGGIVWFVKTNGALNAYWETLARGGFPAGTAAVTPNPPWTS